MNTNHNEKTDPITSSKSIASNGITETVSAGSHDHVDNFTNNFPAMNHTLNYNEILKDVSNPNLHNYLKNNVERVPVAFLKDIQFIATNTVCIDGGALLKGHPHEHNKDVSGNPVTFHATTHDAKHDKNLETDAVIQYPGGALGMFQNLDLSTTQLIQEALGRDTNKTSTLVHETLDSFFVKHNITRIYSHEDDHVKHDELSNRLTTTNYPCGCGYCANTCALATDSEHNTMNFTSAQALYRRNINEKLGVKHLLARDHQEQHISITETPDAKQNEHIVTVISNWKLPHDLAPSKTELLGFQSFVYNDTGAKVAMKTLAHHFTDEVLAKLSARDKMLLVSSHNENKGESSSEQMRDSFYFLLKDRMYSNASEQLLMIAKKLKTSSALLQTGDLTNLHLYAGN